jgi:hypothetical protein
MAGDMHIGNNPPGFTGIKSALETVEANSREDDAAHFTVPEQVEVRHQDDSRTTETVYLTPEGDKAFQAMRNEKNGEAWDIYAWSNKDGPAKDLLLKEIIVGILEAIGR